jgi:cell division protein FtsB
MQSLPMHAKKRKVKKIVFSFPIILMLGVFSVLSIKGVFSAYAMYTIQDERRGEAVAELAALKERESLLSQENAWLQTERGKEQLFREQYMVAKSGENVMIVVSDNVDAAQSVTKEIDDKTILQKTKKVFSAE